MVVVCGPREPHRKAGLCRIRKGPAIGAFVMVVLRPSLEKELARELISAGIEGLLFPSFVGGDDNLIVYRVNCCRRALSLKERTRGHRSDESNRRSPTPGSPKLNATLAKLARRDSVGDTSIQEGRSRSRTTPSHWSLGPTKELVGSGMFRG